MSALWPDAGIYVPLHRMYRSRHCERCWGSPLGDALGDQSVLEGEYCVVPMYLNLDPKSP